MHTILGSGGVIGNVLLAGLSRRGKPIRLVARNPKPDGGAREAVPADLSNLEQTVKAVAGSSVVYLVVGLRYHLGDWQNLWPRIMQNTIEACKRANAKLVFLDNVYMYGKVSGPMTEDTPFNPCSKKGEIRARIATMLLDEMKAGNLTALIARSADFYGPNARTGVVNVLVFDRFAKGEKGKLLVDDSHRHSYTYTPDAADGMIMLADSESAWNKTWHLPTADNPPTGKQFVAMAAKEFGVPPTYGILSGWMIRMAGIFDPTIREVYEMLYQNDAEYIFDASRFSNAFGFNPTSYAEGIRQTAAAYK